MHQSKQFDHIEPLVVPPRVAMRMLGCGVEKLYKMLNSGRRRRYSMPIS